MGEIQLFFVHIMLYNTSLGGSEVHLALMVHVDFPSICSFYLVTTSDAGLITVEVISPKVIFKWAFEEEDPP